MAPFISAASTEDRHSRYIHYRRSPDCLGCDDDDDVHLSFTTTEEQSALLSNIEDLDAVKAVIPLNIDGVPTEDERQLYEILKTLKSTDSSLEDIDGNLRPLPEDTTAVSTTEADTSVESDAGLHDNVPQVIPTILDDFYTLPPMIVLAVSSFVALLAVLCVGAGLYAYNHANSIMVKSGLAWDVLPRLEKRIGLDDTHGDDSEGGASLAEKRGLLGLDTPLPPVNVFSEKEELDEKGLLVDIAESDVDDLDERFHDAPEDSLLFLDPDQTPRASPRPELPRIVVDEHADPDFLPLPDLASEHSTPFATPLRTPSRTPETQMREVPSSPLSKPAWSLRADGAPVLGLTSPSPTATRSASPMLPGALFPDDAPEMVQVQRPRQQIPRQPLDIAFALQLRPGLGLGADSAWLVRFLMAMFGWMTFFIGGPRREEPRRALTA